MARQEAQRVTVMARTKHWREDWATYHVTTRTLNKAFFLASDRDKMVIIKALDFYQERGDFVLFAYVIMSNHVHLVIQPSSGAALPDVMENLKKWTSRHNTAKPRNASLWERRYDDNAIGDMEEMREVVTYIHQNPIRAGLVKCEEDYVWSSARNYAGIMPVMLEVTTEW